MLYPNVPHVVVRHDQCGNRRCHVAPYAMLRARRKMCSFKGVRHGRMQDRGNDIDDRFV
jgi:hypothetical protein